ncbi:hypothetical protein ACFYYM_25190 [Streptomyces erythrochromogenes]|uniref:hypothetical protein n=1 Tax=Streptomyces erythrochromogenes TaxID=285574 RepID=UPI0036CEC2CA
MLVRHVEGGRHKRDQPRAEGQGALDPGKAPSVPYVSRYCPHLAALTCWEISMDRTELQAKIEELMRQYHDEEIDGATYFQAMMELTASAQE